MKQEGNTALHVACEKGHMTTAAFLVQHGVDSTLVNKVTSCHNFLQPSFGHFVPGWKDCL